MKNKFTLLLLCLFTACISSRAQYVNVPDSIFRFYLISQSPGCFNGAGQMDTTCIQSVTQLLMEDKGIRNFEGLQYFKNLSVFHCGGNLLTDLPPLPNSLKEVWIDRNLFTQLPPIPKGVIILHAYYKC